MSAIFLAALLITECGGGSGGSSGSTGSSPQAASLNAAIVPSAVPLGETATLTWSSTGTSTCTAGGAWSGSRASGGSAAVKPGAAGTLLYSLTCSGSGGTATASVQLKVGPALDATAALGEQIFFDPSLSASGKISCSTCHDPGHAYGPPNDLAVQPGGAELNSQGARAVPSLEYKEQTPAFVLSSAALEAGSPAGGLDWDGRADTLQAQPAFPLLAANEMANADAAAVATELRAASYAGEFQQVFGADALADPDTALQDASAALAQYQLQDIAFHPYNSKFDAYLAGTVALSAQEQSGKMLFDIPNKGGCAACHLDTTAADGSPPVLTDYEFEAVGVPRNGAIAANADPNYFDMGLCGPLRTDLSDQTQYCGMFKTPTLRNVATRQAFFHNGLFHTLTDTLKFYVQRDTDPALWYPANPDGSIDKFNDLPAAYRANVDVSDPPFNRETGATPALSDAEIADLIVFLQTLNDGYQSAASGG